MKRLFLTLVALAGLATASAQLTPNKIVVPDIEGYKTLKCDFHMHTVFADAQVSPVGRVREAWQDGLDVIAVSEHIAVHKSPGIKLKDYNIPINHAPCGYGYGLLRSYRLYWPRYAALGAHYLPYGRP